MLIRHLEFDEKELTQNTPPFQAQHWKILLTIRGSLEEDHIYLAYKAYRSFPYCHSVAPHFISFIGFIFPAPTVLPMFS